MEGNYKGRFPYNDDKKNEYLAIEPEMTEDAIEEYIARFSGAKWRITENVEGMFYALHRTADVLAEKPIIIGTLREIYMYVRGFWFAWRCVPDHYRDKVEL